MQHHTIRAVIVAIGLSIATLLAPASAHAVLADVTAQCNDSATPLVAGSFGTSLVSTTAVNFGAHSAGSTTLGTYNPSGNCSFRIAGTAQFTADAAKVGQLFLNNFSIRNTGTVGGTVRIDYRHQNRSADPNTAQCVSLSADGFFYNPNGSTTGDGFELNMTVIYHKSGSVFRTFVVGVGTVETATAAAIGTCPTTAGSDSNGLVLDGIMTYLVGTDPFFNPQNPAQIFNRIPACSGCTTGTTSQAGARIIKGFEVFLGPGHEISSIATVRGGMAEQASNGSASQLALQNAANKFLIAANTADCARIDHKPGQSNNFLQNNNDQGQITVDLLGGPCFDVADLVAIDGPQGLRLFAGTSGLDGGTAGDFHEDPPVYVGAPVVKFWPGDFNNDGFPDIRLHFDQAQLDVRDGDDRVQVRGTLRVIVPEVDQQEVLVQFRAEDSAIVQ